MAAVGLVAALKVEENDVYPFVANDGGIGAKWSDLECEIVLADAVMKVRWL